MLETTSEFCFLYTTYPDANTARMSARLVVDKKLAACVNIYQPMTSIYMWQGNREEASEYAVFIKTRRALVEDVIAQLWPLHPYELPSFVVLPVDAGTDDYLAWVRSETEPVKTI